MDTLIGKTLSHYRIVEQIGAGGMGVVYRAHDERLERDVALKVLPSGTLADEAARKRFRKEALALSKLNHPNIATIYDFDTQEGVDFLVMEYIAGATLDEKLRAGPVPEKEVGRLGIQLAQGLAYAHREGVVHTDLKPSNLRITPDGWLKILDFGLARLARAAGESSTTLSAEPGAVAGTLPYMPPEQLRGETTDIRCDIYSAGAVLYEMAVGRRAFPQASAPQLLEAILHEIPPAPSTMNRNVAQALDGIILKALDKEPERRYQSARELGVDLERLIAPTRGLVSSRARMPVRRWRRVAVGAFIALSVVAVLLGVTRLLRWDFGAPAAKAEENSLAVLAFQNIKNPDDPERLGEILQELAITDLSDLGSLKVFSSQRLHDVERQVHRGREVSGMKALALQVAALAGARTMLTGTLSQLGTTWVLTGHLVDVANGTVITSARVSGSDLYSVMDNLTGRIRDDLRVRMADRSAVNLPVREKTTPSLEAYRRYLAGADRLNALDFEGAILELRRAIAIDSTFGQAYYKLAIATWWVGDEVEAAQEPLSRLLSENLYSSSRERLMAKGALALIGSCHEMARESFEQVTREYPDEKEAWYGLGEALTHGRGDLAKAREAFGHAVALDPTFTIASYHIVENYRLEGKLEAARAELDRLIRADRENPSLHGERVAIDVYSRDEAKVRSSLADALKQLPTSAAKRVLCRLVAEAYSGRTQPDYSRAREIALKALSFDTGKGDPSVYATLGVIAKMQGKAAEAEKWFLRGLEIAPTDPTLIGRLNWLYQSQGRFKDIVSMARRAIAKDPRGAWGWYTGWAGAAVASGDTAEIARAVPAALALRSDRYSLRRIEMDLAEVSLYSGQFVRAEEFSRKAIEAVPECGDPSLYNALGRSLLRQNKRSEAEVAFQKGIALSPQDEGLQNGLLQTYEESGKHHEALEFSKRMCRELPVSLVSRDYGHWIKNAAVLEDRAEIDSALALAGRSTGAPDRGQLLVDVGAAYSGQVYDFAKASQYFRAALPILSARGDTQAANGLGWSLINLGRYSEAEVWFRKSLAKNQEDASALNGLTAILVEQKKYKEAELVAQRYAKVFPLGRARVIQVQIWAGNPRKADRILDHALAELPSVEARRRLLAQVANAYFDRSEIERARTLDRRAAALGPPGAAPDVERFVHGWLLLREGQFAAAESAFVSYQAMTSFNASAAYFIGIARCLRGNSEGVERETRAQIARKPAHLLFHLLLGAILTHEHRFRDALPFAERAVAMDSSRVSYTLLAWTLVSGDLDVPRGAALARRALGIPPPLGVRSFTYPFIPSLEQTLGLAAMKRRDYKSAVRYLEQAARLRPDRPSIQEDLKEAHRRLVDAAPTRTAWPR